MSTRRKLQQSSNAVPAHHGVLQQALKDGPCVGPVGVGHASVMARVEAARGPGSHRAQQRHARLHTANAKAHLCGSVDGIIGARCTFS